jgi:hypothetical protein
MRCMRQGISSMGPSKLHLLSMRKGSRTEPEDAKVKNHLRRLQAKGPIYQRETLYRVSL